MQGIIVKGIAGFYYVHVVESGVYECKAKGIFRMQKIKPLVGDRVEIEVLDQEEKTGNILSLLPRKNGLIRPAVANVDQALVVFSQAMPEPNLNLLDRFLIEMERQNVPVVICFNKDDLTGGEHSQNLAKIYENSGCQVVLTSVKERCGMDQVKELLRGKITTVAGPSGAGKSSLINELQSQVCMETGDISEKIQRGKHTTRHSQLILIEKDTYIMDTPGFTTMYVEHLAPEELKDYFHEFDPFYSQCRFQGCNHRNEPNCKVKEAVEQGIISASRYENYCQLFDELKNKKKEY